MQFRFLLLIPFAALTISATARAQLAVRFTRTAAAPSAVFADRSGRIHVLTAGWDRNFDGIFQPDSGETSAAWFVLNEQGFVVDSVDFGGFFNSYPIRVAVDPEGILYAAQLGRVRAFDMATLELLRDTVVAGAYSGVSFDSPTGSLVLHRRPGFAVPGSVEMFDPKNARPLMWAETGSNPQMSVSRVNSATGLPEIITLAEGTASDARLTWTSWQPDIDRVVNGGPMGGGATQIVDNGKRVAVVLNGTHQVRLYDRTTLRELPPSPIAVGTTGFDGPRSAVLLGDSLLVVGTYASDIRFFDLSTGRIVDSVRMPGKVEALLREDSVLFAAIKYGPGGYDPDSVVLALNLNTHRPIDTIVVGLDPSAIEIGTTGSLNAVGFGTSDSTHWWTLVDVRTHAVTARRTLTGTLPFPTRLVRDSYRGGLLLPLGGAIVRLPDSSPSDSIEVVYRDSASDAIPVSVTPTGPWLAVVEAPKNFSPDAGYLRIVSQPDGHCVASARTGSFPAVAIKLPSSREPLDRILSFVVLNEGTFGSPSSSLTRFEFAPDMLAGELLGSVGNHILLSSDGRSLVATMNGSHELAFVDLDTWNVTERIPTGTTGYGGPRETAELVVGGSVPSYAYAISTYSNQLLLASKESGSISYSVPIEGKLEGVMASLGGVAPTFVVGVAMKPDYSPDDRVAFVGYSLGIGGETGSVRASIEALPNPVANRASVRIELPTAMHVRAELHSLRGELIRSLWNGPLGGGVASLDLDVSDLPPGAYLLTLRTIGGSASKVVEVVR